jgi:hypothetical protein
MKAICKCGHEFILTSLDVEAWSNFCDCCEDESIHIEIRCPACYESTVIRDEK